MLDETNKAYNETQNALGETNRLYNETQKALDDTKKALAIREAQIESAKRQYNELMEVATRYRDEAAKWRLLRKL